MATDAPSATTRRALLAGAVGGAVALIASALGRAEPVLAGTDGDVVLGASNYADRTTTIDNYAGDALVVRSNAGSGLKASGTKSNPGVVASGDSYGVTGVGRTTGVYGEGGCLGADGHATGVLGYSGPGSPPVPALKTGVYGYAAEDASAVGIRGVSISGRGVEGVSAEGLGVRAGSTTGFGLWATSSSGTAAWASTTTGYALRTTGRLRLEKASGVAVIPRGKPSVLVAPGLDLTQSSFVLLTPRADIGSRRLWYTTDATANTITIRVSSAVTATSKWAGSCSGKGRLHAPSRASARGRPGRGRSTSSGSTDGPGSMRKQVEGS